MCKKKQMIEEEIKMENIVKIGEKQDDNIQLINERAGTIIQYRNTFLGVWQKSSKFFSFPKGGKLINESFEECAKRELLEETGIDLPIEEYFKSSTKKIIIESNISQQQKEQDTNIVKNPYKYIFYWIRLKKNQKPFVEIKSDNDEIADYEWCTLNGLFKKRRQQKMGSIIYEVVKKLQQFKNENQ